MAEGIQLQLKRNRPHEAPIAEFIVNNLQINSSMSNSSKVWRTSYKSYNHLKWKSRSNQTFIMKLLSFIFLLCMGLLFVADKVHSQVNTKQNEKGCVKAYVKNMGSKSKGHADVNSPEFKACPFDVL